MDTSDKAKSERSGPETNDIGIKIIDQLGTSINQNFLLFIQITYKINIIEII